MGCSYKNRVFDYLKGKNEDPDIEKHIESCPECSALVEGYLEKEKELDIPNTVYEGGDQKLKEQVVHYEKGTRRIVIFTLLGLIMGWFSISYYTDSFLPTKIILAIPYKISEIFYGLIHDIPYAYTRAAGAFIADAYFPQNRALSFLAERITPVLTGGAVYGSFAFFTGDSRIFTLKKYLKFAAAWALAIGLYGGALTGLNAYGVKKNNELKDIEGFFLNSESYGELFSEEYEGYGASVFELLEEAFYEDGEPEPLTDVRRAHLGEIQLEIWMGKYRGGYMIAYVNPAQRYLVTDEGIIYRITERFAGYIQKFWDDQFRDASEDYEMSGKVDLDEKLEN
ncbi:hypothetical protein GPL15_17480 [Clostridium sp. MCC353]|uniref:hypothetical protein n=1 Tax=Clostridium sp. MCC353 TaxID=2592646 RepID=UPI001C026B5B|nr:hypothetical protein [Clostridium sp. MCC353]MBT9778293.1 hypothetical protein [Clostridium sp. MCC353]